ncbi:MAG: hypothetical protein AAGI11_04040 [Pseudomonadota bacterium]
MTVFLRIISIAMLCLGLTVQANAQSITFEAVCVQPSDCDGDSGFSFELTFDISVVIPNTTYNATADGGANLIQWSISSSVGDGFDGGGEGLEGILGVNGDLLFSFNDQGVLEAILDSAGNNSFVFDIPPEAAVGQFNWRNQSTEVANRADLLVNGMEDDIADSTDITVAFQVRGAGNLPASVPLPRYILPMMVLFGLFGAWRYRGLLRLRRGYRN